jgi:hypothetical protein
MFPNWLRSYFLYDEPGSSHNTLHDYKLLQGETYMMLHYNICPRNGHTPKEINTAKNTALGQLCEWPVTVTKQTLVNKYKKLHKVKQKLQNK